MSPSLSPRATSPGGPGKHNDNAHHSQQSRKFAVLLVALSGSLSVRGGVHLQEQRLLSRPDFALAASGAAMRSLMHALHTAAERVSGTELLVARGVFTAQHAAP